jgi:carbon-monoxide dehydrogenase medium subunit
VKPAPFAYHRPGSLDEALALLADDPDAKPLAGGQSLVPMLNFRLARPAALVDLSAIEELAGIRVEEGTLVVGAMTRQWDLEHADEAHPLLREALAFVGHTATRCRGTVGGSLAHADPTAELPVCAVALGAELVVAGPGGRRVVPAEEFFVSVFMTALEPGELLIEVRFPAAAGGSAFEEHAHRHGDFAVVCVAVAGERVALGGVGATPVLWDGGELEPVGDLFAPAGYKREVATALIERALGRAAA